MCSKTVKLYWTNVLKIYNVDDHCYVMLKNIPREEWPPSMRKLLRSPPLNNYCKLGHYGSVLTVVLPHPEVFIGWTILDVLLCVPPALVHWALGDNTLGAGPMFLANWGWLSNYSSPLGSSLSEAYTSSSLVEDSFIWKDSSQSIW